MNAYSIYQVKSEYLRGYGFRSLEAIRRDDPKRLGLPREAWELVYVYETESEPSLDWLFCLFNGAGDKWPEDFTGRSMSVSDVVVMDDPDEGVRAWYCDSVGFVSLPEEVWPCRG